MRRIYRIFCTCHGIAPTEPLQKGYRFIWRDWEGVTLGWSARPEIAIVSGYRCTECLEVYEIRGHYIPGHGSRDETGWPLTKAGERMPLAQDGTYRERECTLPG